MKHLAGTGPGSTKRLPGIGLVFVTGHTGCYPKSGFAAAGARSFEAPNPSPAENAAAWMAQAPRAGVIGKVHVKVRCADSRNDPRHWYD